jgi:hypothetical protein
MQQLVTLPGCFGSIADLKWQCLERPLGGYQFTPKPLTYQKPFVYSGPSSLHAGHLCVADPTIKLTLDLRRTRLINQKLLNE